MIPNFNESGYLPPGLHLATLEEVERRFGRESEIRRMQAESLQWLVDLARRAGVKRLILNGSFVTDTMEPNDIDCVALIDTEPPRDVEALAELKAGLPFLDIHVVLEDAFELLVRRTFATDRHLTPKGMVEVLL